MIRSIAYLDNWFSGSWETRSPVYTVKLKPVFSVPVSTGIASSTAAASENGVSLFRVKIRSSQYIATNAFKVKLGTNHATQPWRGAGRRVLFRLSALGLFARQHRPVVQFASEPVA